MTGMTANSKPIVKACRKRKIAPLSEAEQKLVVSHSHIAEYAAYSAISHTRGYTGCFTKEDLESIAYWGLCVAAKDFDPSKGFQFSTYASRKVKGYIQHELRDKSRMVKIPRFVLKFRKEVRDLSSRGWSIKEISDELGLTLEQVVECEHSWGEIHRSYDQKNRDSDGQDSVSFELPSYDPDPDKIVGRSMMVEFGSLTEPVIEMLNNWHYHPENRKFMKKWELEFCENFFKLYRGKLAKVSGK